jgi:hypothetical protein
MNSNGEVSDRGDDGETSGEWVTLDGDNVIHLRRANGRRSGRPLNSSPGEDVTVHHRPNLEETQCSPSISRAHSRTLASVSDSAALRCASPGIRFSPVRYDEITERGSRSVVADVVQEELSVRRRNYQTTMHPDGRMASVQHISEKTGAGTTTGNAVGNAFGNIGGNTFHHSVGNAVGTSYKNSRRSAM